MASQKEDSVSSGGTRDTLQDEQHIHSGSKMDSGAHAAVIEAAAGRGAQAPSGYPSAPDDAPGKSTTLLSKVMDTATGAIQNFKPLNRVCQHVCAFHIYAHDATRQVRAHHFCSHVNEEFRQCVIYDDDTPNARLIGIEYIISRRLFEQLPDDEKKFWHSHVYEVTSGILTAPNVPQVAENEEMKKLVNTYGKTWHMWQIDRGDTLPLGPPQLMMAFQGDGQVDAELLRRRDEKYGISTAAIRERRAHIQPDPPQPHPAADHPFHTGKAWQTSMQATAFQGPGSQGSK